MTRFETYCALPVSNRASSRRTTGVPNRGTVGHRNEGAPRTIDRYDRFVDGGRGKEAFGGRDLRPLGAAAIVILIAVTAAGAGAMRGTHETAPERTGWTLVALIPAVG